MRSKRPTVSTPPAIRVLLTSSLFSLSLSCISTECTKIFTASPGNLSDLFYAGEQLNVCQYFVRAPGDHLILLNITRLIGFATNSLQNCLPRLVIISASKQNNNKKLSSRTVCSYSEPLPLVVQSDANELRLIFYGSSSVNSGFSATYTFHTKQSKYTMYVCMYVCVYVLSCFYVFSFADY